MIPQTIPESRVESRSPSVKGRHSSDVWQATLRGLLRQAQGGRAIGGATGSGPGTSASTPYSGSRWPPPPPSRSGSVTAGCV
jgi:hypothetical protein